MRPCESDCSAPHGTMGCPHMWWRASAMWYHKRYWHFWQKSDHQMRSLGENVPTVGRFPPYTGSVTSTHIGGYLKFGPSQTEEEAESSTRPGRGRMWSEVHRMCGSQPWQCEQRAEVSIPPPNVSTHIHWITDTAASMARFASKYMVLFQALISEMVAILAWATANKTFGDLPDVRHLVALPRCLCLLLPTFCPAS